ncbi:unnamed protein product [Durusdinium trenchii]|uniref:Uncharacterized protein n=1 Tax=Durusdinium trenchii TaxID=1381693 RepID=A0ABP0KKV3_9DINO
MARGLLQVRSALEMFQDSPGCSSQNVFFYMCFFANNQYRMIVENSSNGSDNLEDVFESNLKRIGRMVAILDTWDQPVYLSRVWTVYEQFVASTLQIEVQFVLPKDATDHLQRQIACGSKGIDEVIKSLSQVNSEKAEAWMKADENKVKSLIQELHSVFRTVRTCAESHWKAYSELPRLTQTSGVHRPLPARAWRSCQIPGTCPQVPTYAQDLSEIHLYI